MRQRRFLAEDEAAAWHAMLQGHRLYRERMVFVDNLLLLGIHRNHLHLILHGLHEILHLLLEQGFIILWSIDS